MSEPFDSPLKLSPEAEDASTFRQKVKGTNINEQSLLATDYLNHFNEIVMLLELIPDMPEFLDDAKEWSPKSYQEHFRDSVFSDRELAIAAYEHSPAKYRAPFEETVSHLNRLVVASLSRIEAALQSGEREMVKIAVSAASKSLQKLIDVASAIIHGSEITLSQDEIDDLLRG